LLELYCDSDLQFSSSKESGFDKYITVLTLPHKNNPVWGDQAKEVAQWLVKLTDSLVLNDVI